jgi:hypothetical protein
MKSADYILLDSRNACPKCFARYNFSGSHDYCTNCGLRLFRRPVDFIAFEEGTNIRNWWCWDVERGWVFRDHYMVERAKPLNRVQKIDPLALDKKYGRDCTPEQAATAFRNPANKVRHRRTK